jgi:hypothetical protein
MARSKIGKPTNDLMSDSGSVLWSFVKGEQLEYPVTLDFIERADAGYSFEAVVVEGAASFDDDDVLSVQLASNGAQTILAVDVPIDRGVWDPINTYNQRDIAEHEGIYYKKLYDWFSIDVPPNDPSWEVTTPNIIYVRFPSTLGNNWTEQPTPTAHAYAFFELRVTEPGSVTFARTWKPVRGLVEVQFSPTDLVPDI